jgi:pimeloyl-ACP methyl ester carboxylesterase
MNDGFQAAAIFVHGLFSGPHTWESLVSCLQVDPVIARAYKILRFEYDTPKARFSLTRRIPQLSDISNQFRTWIASHADLSTIPRIVLVGHSFGGLVIQRFIHDELSAGRGHSLRKVRAVVLFATPNYGSEILLSARRAASWLGIYRQPQERATRPFDDEIDLIRRSIIEKAVYASGIGDSHCKIDFIVYAGASDRVVPPISAKGVFPRAGVLPGDHFSIIAPTCPTDQVCVEMKAHLLHAKDTFVPHGMIVTTEMLNIADDIDVTAVVRIQHDMFPTHAHMDQGDLIRCFRTYESRWGIRPKVLLVKVNGTTEGFSLFSETPKGILVGYIAVRESATGDLLTSHLYSQIHRRSEELGDVPIVFEVYDPSRCDGSKRREALSRIRVFQRKGARLVGGLSYLAPDMSNLTKGKEEPYLLMYAKPGQIPAFLSKSQVAELLEVLYKVFYEYWFCDRYEEGIVERYLDDLKARVLSTVGDECVLKTQ